MRGEAGIGKTALLEYVMGRASGCRLVSVSGVESEMELGVRRPSSSCAPLLDKSGHLPDPQREALATAFGLNAGDVPTGSMVGLAVLSLLAEVAQDEPLLA